MFESDFLDLFSRTHPIVVPILYVPAAAVAFVWSMTRSGQSFVATLGLSVAGFLFWSLVEYWLHRLVFHWQMPTRIGARIHFLIHGVHHQWPRDKYRLVFPPGASIPLYLLFMALFRVTLGRAGWGVLSGFVVGYMFYDLTHYFLHHITPRTAYGRRLRRNHMLHHFKTPSVRFGVSNMVWDRVFGTRGEAPRRVDLDLNESGSHHA
jgi:dihydroceramide fatty acyl 2-hydroxylase